MASAPKLKGYNPQGEYVAACKHAEDAAAIVAAYGSGATIRWNHRRILWEEGKETAGKAGDSYDIVASVVNERMG